MAISQYHFKIRIPRSYKGDLKFMKPLQGNEWDCKARDFPKKRLGLLTRRNKIKKIIKGNLNRLQGHFCAFCGLDLRTRGAQIEHIAPKAPHLYPQFMWEPKNLILACPLCNGFAKKSTYDSISTLDTRYSNCHFKIVHPYFDNPTHHFRYVMDPQTNLAYLITIQDIGGVPSPKGKQSILLFGLDLPDMTEERYKDALAQSQPVRPDFEKLIDEVKSKGYISK